MDNTTVAAISTNRTRAGAGIRLGYLVSRYPAFSHTFILHEVLRLKAQGFDIHVASVNDADRDASLFTANEAAEAALVYYIKRDGWRGALAALADALRRRPLDVLRGLWFSLRIAGADIGLMAYHLFYFVEALMVGRWMRRLGISHLHVHFATPASTVGLICKQMFPIGFSFMVHGPDEFYDVSRYKLREKIEGADFVLTIGAFSRSQLMKLSPPSQWPKFEACPLGVDPHMFTPIVTRDEPKPVEVICVGRLVPAKGQHILVKALSRAVLEGVDVRLRLVGDGPDMASLRSQVRALALDERVVFEGAVNQDRVRELYRGADIFALASFAEGIPIVLMEAMAMCIPCVTTFITGIPELIESERHGLLVPPSDDQALADAIVRLARDDALRQRLGKAGRERVLEKYDLDTNTAHLASVFRERIEGLRSRDGATG